MIDAEQHPNYVETCVERCVERVALYDHPYVEGLVAVVPVAVVRVAVVPVAVVPVAVVPNHRCDG